MPGFAPCRAGKRRRDPRQEHATSGATLQLANVQEAVTVTGATPLIDTRKVETGVTFSPAKS